MHSDIATLVGSRICHDLISPLGAIGNGVELLGLTQSTDGAEMALISESVENANARILFFRIAFGAAGADQMIARSEVLKVLTLDAKGGRFTYFWRVDDNQKRREVRMAFLMLQCFESAMPTGGDITIAQTGGAWVLTAETARLNADPDLWASLTNPETQFQHSAAQVQFALLPPLLAETGMALSVEMTADKITARIG